MKAISKLEKFNFLDRYTDKIYPSKEKFLTALNSKKLVIYHGVDPTAPDLHLAHSTNYLLLREFQKMGHKIILLIGDFTAQIGDPTGRAGSRKILTKKEVLINSKTYKKQISKILDFKSKTNPAQIKFNSKWFEKMEIGELMTLCSNFTHGRIIKRNMFQERIKKGREIFISELLYPLFQAYDSLAMDVDVEIGGTDQTFNMLMGRDFISRFKEREKFVITTPILENPKNNKKLMSKSEGGYIALSMSSNEMYGKIMALPDEVIIVCLKLCTQVSLSDIEKIEKQLKLKKINPRDAKMKLAMEVVKIYHGEKKSLLAEKQFGRVFKQKKNPLNIEEVKIKRKHINILDLLIKTKMVNSRAEAKRLIIQKSVKINNKIQENWKKNIEIKNQILQVGKRKFIKII